MEAPLPRVRIAMTHRMSRRMGILHSVLRLYDAAAVRNVTSRNFRALGTLIDLMILGAHGSPVILGATMYILYGGDFTRSGLVQWVLDEGELAYQFRKIDIVAGENKAP